MGAEVRHGAGFVDGLAGIEQCLGAAREETGTALLHPRCGSLMTNLLMDLDGLRAGRNDPLSHVGRPHGRAEEQAVTGLLCRSGLPRRQHAGTIGLFAGGSRTAG